MSCKKATDMYFTIKIQLSNICVKNDEKQRDNLWFPTPFFTFAQLKTIFLLKKKGNDTS